MKRRELTEIERKAASNISSLLWMGFPWELTPQGTSYWHEVAIALENLANPPVPPKCEKCGQVMSNAV